MIEKFKLLSNIEKVIFTSLLITGSLLTYNSIYLIYAYNFTGILFMFMIPMTTLVNSLTIGLLLIISSFVILKQKSKSGLTYKVAGILIVLYPLNKNLIEIIKEGWFIESLFSFIFFPIGILIYLLFNRKEYNSYYSYKNLQSIDKYKFIFCLCWIFIIDILFVNWTYLDEIIK